MFKAPLVVGYKGEIGSFILGGLLKVMDKAVNIYCFDINETEEEKVERIIKSDVIFLCVPLQETIPWLEKYKPLLNDKLIIEQCSLKQDLFENKVCEGLRISSMHILFRPSATPDFKDRRCVFMGGAYLTEFEKNVLPSVIKVMTQSEIIMWDNYEIHDIFMAFEQALVHRVILTLSGILAEHAGGHTYMSAKIGELARRIYSGDKELYKKIQDNKFFDEVLQTFKEKLDQFEIK